MTTAEHRAALADGDQREATVGECSAAEGGDLTPATDRQKRAAAEAEVVDVRIDGDVSTAYLRLDGCTLTASGSEFRRTSDGEWRYDGTLPTSGFAARCVK